MISIKNLSKTFETKDGRVEALKDINLEINDGDIYGIIGMSGAGKSTLVRCINMLEKPTAGAVEIDGRDLTKMSDRELREIRKDVTMIFQKFNLLMQRTCIKNVMFPLEISGISKKEAKEKALELLETVGLSDKANAYPAQLSG
ncbi:MAG: ATP-binding cassette domain-containing protein, partial [Firmicutes bacterium]|nr:ATP-binding cassette domain-containing protein [Bacillota bacterium]